MASSEEESLRKALSYKLSLIEGQGNAVRQLKASGAAKPDIDAAVQALNALKLDKASIESQLRSAIGASSSVSRDAFRQAVAKVLQQHLFYRPSFSIYGGVTGLYDYGPPGCAHFVLEENMLEVDCPCVTPEIVLKASGHVEKFTDLMVKDENTGMCYRADHLLKDYCKEKLEKDLSMTPAMAAELNNVMSVLDGFSPEQLGGKIKENGITAPDTKNPLSDPYPFNLMFQTSIGPSGLSPGYMCPETAQGIFVNFKDLYFYNGSELPFAAAQIGQAFRNEGIVNNETLAYFIGRVYLFLTRLGIDKERLRFRQHLANEMAHYAADCWDVEIECSYGWIECVGIADRSAYDLCAHTEKSGVLLVAQEKFPEPREVGAMNEEEAMKLKSDLEAKGEAPLRDKLLSGKAWSQFQSKRRKNTTEFSHLLLLSPRLDRKYNEIANSISRSLTAAGISRKIDITGDMIGKRYARTDELGCPLCHNC
ncbi:hypothetical protein RJ639_045505 [Escallonia herrerae]|uniref:WHEP-TRS domain-containing protein n=1 Tax=Escallonia herrerae TaxID=1293975 RepID=A0AA89B403_9ASTE|nr:hypothetical protein RJ639_045505 [Escallonia herrerae]